MTNAIQAGELIQQAISELGKGEKMHASQLLISAVQMEPTSQLAWLWLSRAVATEDERIQCFDQIIAIDPNTEIAIQAQDKLKAILPPNQITPIPNTQGAASGSPQ